MNERRTGPEMGNPGATNKGRGTPAMKPKPPSTVDPIEREIERALQPGAFIRDGQCASFVSGLEEIATTVDKLITTDPARAVELYETFLAGCHAKADELDDSILPDDGVPLQVHRDAPSTGSLRPAHLLATFTPISSRP